MDIEAKNLSKSYGGKTAIKSISFSVAHGEVVGLLGANGAGKTTTVETILGTRKPDSGSATILGKEPAKNRKDLFQKVGVQFQEGSYQEKIKVNELCSLTAALYHQPQDYHALLSQFGLGEKEHAMVSDLSGGQRQRLFIVLALIPGPQVLFLDELTTGLDTKARRDVWQTLSALEDKTILLTSHFMDEVEALCDRIIILKEGEIVFTGTVKEAIVVSACNCLEDAYLFLAEEGEAV